MLHAHAPARPPRSETPKVTDVRRMRPIRDATRASSALATSRSRGGAPARESPPSRPQSRRATQRIPDARRRHSSRRARRARRCRPACGFHQRDSYRARPPPRPAAAAARAARAAGQCGCSNSPCSETRCTSRDRNSAVSSFVVVFPALPVMATTFAPDRRRTSRARSCSARVVSPTSIADRPRPPAAGLVAHHRAPPHPPPARPRRTRGRRTDRRGSPRTDRLARASANRWTRARAGDPDRPNQPPARDGRDFPRGQRDRIHPASSLASRCDAAPAPPAPPPRRRTAASGADHLVLLVPLAGDHHEVAGARVADGLLDRRASIDDRERRRRLVAARCACDRPPERSPAGSRR